MTQAAADLANAQWQPAAPACPSCRGPMQALRVQSHRGEAVELDLCFACHGIWFDWRENLQLSAQGVLALFKTLHEHRGEPHRPLGQRMQCPACSAALQRGTDRTISGPYVTYRCPARHGRFGTFSSFMVEKGFVRHLSAAQLHALAETVRTIHCSSCGATVDLRRDHACPYCRSAFALLDPQAVERALQQYQGRAGADSAAPDAANANDEKLRQAMARAEWLIAQERMRAQNAQREREARGGPWGKDRFADELWSMGLDALWRLLARWLR
ncbi:zf-TFIIB domain-containing protein [Vandammella animalimorsus]|nr:zf-TFIIB domain-containing protein [Vandammella animalimorsus]